MTFLTPSRCAALLLLAIFSSAQAQESDSPDIDSRFKAKIAKERARMAGAQSAQGGRGGQGAQGADCGSQNIGNVNTGGRIGSQPREVFVYAPNAINMVSSRSCN